MVSVPFSVAARNPHEGHFAKAEVQTRSFGAGTDLRETFKGVVSRAFAANDAQFQTSFNPTPAISQAQEYDNTTLMQRLTGNTYQAQTIEVSRNTFTTDAPVTTGVQAAQNLGGAQANVSEVKARFTQDFKDARSQMANAVRDVSQERGLDGNAVLGAMGATTHEAGNASAISMAASPVGGPLFEAVSSAMYVYNEIKSEAKKGGMSKEEMSDIIAAALDRVRAQNAAPQDSRAERVAAALDPSPKFKWEEIKPADALELLQSNPENQPEMKQIAQVEHTLEKVADNHHHVAAHYGDSLTLGKVGAAGLGGDLAFYQALVATGRPSSDTQADASTFALAGEGISGISALNLSGGNIFVLPTVEEERQAVRHAAPVLAPRVTASLGLA